MIIALNIGLFEMFSISSLTMNSGPSPSILGFISTFDALGVDFCSTFPFKVLHFKSFMLLSNILKLFNVSG